MDSHGTQLCVILLILMLYFFLNNENTSYIFESYNILIDVKTKNTSNIQLVLTLFNVLH